VSKQEINTAAIAEFAKVIYSASKTKIDTPIFTHCLSTARLAEQIAHKLFADMRGDLVPQDVNDIIAAIVNSAILSETINTGRADFEAIADIANVQIASMVATLSRDLRLVETKRDMEYRGRLSQSPVSTQIVAVAGIVCSAQETIGALRQNNVALIPKVRKILAQLDADLLAIHAASRYYVLRLYTHAARNLILDANQIIKKIRNDAKIARTIEKHTATLRNKVAAKTAVIELKPKEHQNGKKRASRKSV